MDTSKRWRQCSFVLLALGWLLSGYLVLRMMSLGNMRLGGQSAVSLGALCSGCDDALANSASWTHGIPLPATGLIYFAFVAFLLILGTPWTTRLAFLMSAAGAGIGIALSAALFKSPAPCFLCLLIHGIDLILCLTLFVQVSRQLSPEDQRPLFSSSKTWAFIAVMIVATSGLVGAMISQPGVSQQALDTKKLFAEYNSAPIFEIPSDPSDAILGKPDGRLRLVVFSSFQCPWCQVFAPSVHRLAEEYGDRLTVVFKNYPLSKTCNPGLAADVQPRSCAAAWAAEAARRQNAFWRFHDGLFSDSLDDSEELLRAIARSAGVDMERWEKDRHSPDVQAKIANDVALGLKLRVVGTPTVFLNNRRIKNPSLPILDLLIKEEIKKST